MRFFMLSGALLGLSVAARAQTAAPASTWNGPLPVQNGRPYQSVFLHFPPQSPDVLPPKSSGYGVQFDVANNLLIPEPSNGATVREDFETARARLEYRRGLGRGWEASASGQIVVRDGGLLDGPIEFYHRLLGLDGNGRDNPQGREDIPRGQDILFFRDADGNGVNRGRGTGLGDTTLSLKRQLRQGNLAAATRFALKLPTGSRSQVFGSGGLDFGADLDARLALSSRLALFGQAALLKFGASDLPNTKRGGAQGGLGLEWKLSRRASLVAQIDAQTRSLTTGNAFADRTPVLASVGYKRRVGKNNSLWASFSENGDYTNYHAPFFGNIGPDFTLSLGYEVRR